MASEEELVVPDGWNVLGESHSVEGYVENPVEAWTEAVTVVVTSLRLMVVGEVVVCDDLDGCADYNVVHQSAMEPVLLVLVVNRLVLRIEDRLVGLNVDSIFLVQIDTVRHFLASSAGADLGTALLRHAKIDVLEIVAVLAVRLSIGSTNL